MMQLNSRNESCEGIYKMPKVGPQDAVQGGIKDIFLIALDKLIQFKLRRVEMRKEACPSYINHKLKQLPTEIDNKIVDVIFSRASE